jgi:flagellar motor component MotA
VAVIGSGVFVAAALIVVGFLTAPPDSPGIFRLQALIIIAGAFAIGAVAGKGLHVVASWKRQTPRLL